jgi:hypothetical protein
MISYRELMNHATVHMTRALLSLVLESCSPAQEMHVKVH